MNGSTWYVITAKDANGMRYSFAQRISNCNDLLHYFRRPNLETVNACATMRADPGDRMIDARPLLLSALAALQTAAPLTTGRRPQ